MDVYELLWYNIITGQLPSGKTLLKGWCVRVKTGVKDTGGTYAHDYSNDPDMSPTNQDVGPQSRFEPGPGAWPAGMELGNHGAWTEEIGRERPCKKIDAFALYEKMKSGW